MSGVLDRLARRALGTLPAVQPLAAPRFAALRSEPASSAAAAGLETTTEVEASAPVGAMERDRTRVAARDRQIRQEKDGTTDRIDEQEPQVSLERSVAGGNWRFPPERPSPQIGVARDEPIADEAAQTTPGEAKPMVRDVQLEQPVHGREMAQVAKSVPRAKAMEPSREQAKAEPLTDERESSEPTSVLARRNEERAEPEVVRLSDDARTGQPAPAPVNVRRGAPLREQRIASAPDDKTEIHISIGSIELRAPRPEPRPPAPPFRPRVTLDQFLRRPEGSRP